MQNKFVLLFCSAMMLGAVSCSNEDLVLEPAELKPQIKFSQEEYQFLDKLYGSKTVSIEDAMQLVVDSPFDYPKTRSGEADVNEIKYITKSNIYDIPDNVLSVLPDTIAYVFRTADEKCMIVSSDYRVSNPVMGYINTQDLYPYDFGKNDLSIRDILIESIANYTYHEILEFENKKDSMDMVIQNKISASNNTRGESVTIEGDIITIRHYDYYLPNDTTTVGPLLHLAWDQGSPYNDDIQNRGTCNDPNYYYEVATGCAQIAAGMILTYWKYPQQLLNQSVYFPINWDVLSSSYNDEDSQGFPYDMEAAGLMAIINYHTTKNYGCETTVDEDDFYSWLSNIGYKYEKINGYNYNKVKASLDNGRPVFTIGKGAVGNYGHAWVIDGYKTVKKSRHVVITQVNQVTHEVHEYDGGFEYEYEKYLNHNWGKKRPTCWLIEGFFWCHQDTPENQQLQYTFNRDMRMLVNLRP